MMSAFLFYTKADVKLVQKGIDNGCGVDAQGSYITWLSMQSPVHAMEMLGKRYGIGSIESYKVIQEEYKSIGKNGR